MIHAARRAATRYGIELSVGAYWQLVKLIKNGRATFVSNDKKHPTRSLWLLSVQCADESAARPVDFLAVYDTDDRGFIVTFLPLDALGKRLA